jgi:hypothetical protein
MVQKLADDARTAPALLNGKTHAFLAARFNALTAQQAFKQRGLASDATREQSPIFHCFIAYAFTVTIPLLPMLH